MEMKPEIRVTNHAQILITLALLGILVSILALYIYYGMYQARQIQPVAEVSVPAVAETDPNAFDDTRRKEIIEALSKQPIEVDPEQTQEIINSLSQNPVEPVTAETERKRAEIIKALQQN